ncbi:MAG: AMP-binding protein [Planctomycetes bacterium]|nr:AMP-binding protein [Planctomycetota bacterium]
MIIRQYLKEVQSFKLRQLFQEIFPHNRFYAAKFAAAGLDPAAIRGVDDLPSLPFTRKEEIQQDQEAHPPYGTNLTYPLERYVRLHQTSGTSGQPICWLDTPESWDWLLRSWKIIFDAARIGKEDRFFIPFSFGPFVGFWAAFEGAVMRGNFCIPGGGLSSSARLRWILDHRITVIPCTPTYALRLAEAAEEEGLDLAASAVRKLIVAGEPGGSIPEVRRRLESAWGARCFDHWGMTEVGPLGFEPCDRPGGIHLIETDCIAEIVDPETGALREQGGRGELVITTLERWGTPLLRYRTGDLVDAVIPAPPEGGEKEEGAGPDFRPNPCTGFPWLRLEGGILGRVDQMVLVRGNNVYPGAIDAIVRQFPEVVEYRAEVFEAISGNRLHLKVEPKNGAAVSAAELSQRIARAVQDRLFFRPEVTVVAAGSLPRFELKAKRFVRIKEG